MKNIIVIIFTIVLGIYIGSNFIMGSGGSKGSSFQEGVNEIGATATEEFKKVTNTTLTSNPSTPSTPSNP